MIDLHLDRDDVLRLMRAINAYIGTVSDVTEAQASDRLQAILEAQTVTDGG